MSFVDCVEAKKEEGIINRKKAEDAIEWYEELEDSHRLNPDVDDSLDRQISEEVVEGAQENIAKDEYRILFDANKIDKIMDDLEVIDRFSDDLDDLGESAAALVTQDMGNLSKIDSVEQMKNARMGEYFGIISSFFDRISKETDDEGIRMVGEKLLRAYLDDNPPSKFYKKMADEYDKLFSAMAERAQLSGLDLNIREKYFPNPIIGREKLADATYEGLERKAAFADFVKREINLNNKLMKDFNTGKPLPDHAELPKRPSEGPNSLYGPEGDMENFGLMGEIYDNIVSNKGGGEIGEFRTSSFRKRNNKMRVIHFADSESWIKFNREFGEGEITNAINSYIERMAGDIAAAERFGTKPNRAKRIVEDFIRKRADEMADEQDISRADMANRVDKQIKKFQSNWSAYFESHFNAPTKLSRSIATAKQLTTSATIGSATISAMFGDAGNAAFTAYFNQLPAWKFATAGVKEFAKSPPQMLLRKMGLFEGKTAAEVKHQMVIEASLTTRPVMDEMLGNARYLNLQQGTEITKTMATKALKWSGVNMATRAKRAAFQVEMGKFLAKVADRAEFDEINEVVGDGFFSGRENGFINMLERHDIGKEEWELLRTMDFKEEYANGIAGEEGVAFRWFRPIDMETEKMVQRTGLPERKLRDVAGKFRRMMLTEQGFAIPTINSRARAIADEAFGTGVVGQAALQYKSFPLTQMVNNTARAFHADGNASIIGALKGRTPWYFMGIMAPYGALAIQTREIAKGNDPRDMTDPKFMLESLAQSGALSFPGNVLLGKSTADSGMFNNQIADLVGGPTFEFADDLLGVPLNNAGRALSPDEETSLGADTADFVRNWMPLQNLWYMRAANDRLIADTLEGMINPRAYERFDKEQKKMIREEGRGQFIPSGDISEARMPDIGTAFGNPPNE